MARLLHVTGEGHEPLPPLAGHVVRTLEWHRYSARAVDATVDAVVASPASPADAVQLVAVLRRAGRGQAVVLLVDGAPGWRSVESAFDSVFLVAGPGGLQVHLDHAYPPADPDRSDGTQPAGDGDPARRHLPRGGTRGMLLSRLGDQAGHVGHDDDVAAWASLAGGRGRTGTARPRAAWRALRDRAGESLVTGDPGPAAGRPRLRPGRSLPGPLGTASTDATHGPGSDEDTDPDGTDPDRPDPDQLVRSLLQVSDRLFGVRETGAAVAGHVQDVVGAAAVVVLVPDGSVWTVVGAVGHRHLEERLQLGPDHWLVTEAAEARHGLLVEDTDVARSRLAGAPLAAWPHLLVCPVPVVEGVVVAARPDEGPAFTAHDLALAAQELDEAGELLSAALAVRELARRLHRHSGLEDPPA